MRRCQGLTEEMRRSDGEGEGEGETEVLCTGPWHSERERERERSGLTTDMVLNFVTRVYTSKCSLRRYIVISDVQYKTP